MTTRSILWRGIDLPGHEACRVYFLNAHWHLDGSAVFSHEGQPCRLDYGVVCDDGWHTRSGKVTGWLGHTPVNVELAVGPDQRWRLNGIECPAVRGCIDLDLNFSPSTNLLPIRRLDLAIGQAAEITAAWLRFPSFELKPLAQVYRRLTETTYRYESSGSQFVAELQVDPAGFVTDYPGIWQAEAAS